MSERPKRTGRRSQTQIRGQAASVSGGCASGRRGRGASSAGASFQSKASEVTAAQVQSTVVSKHMYRKSAVWEFFKKCAADRTIAICNLCQKRIKRGKDIPRLGTTCLRQHMTTCHASRWHNTLHRSSSSSSVSTPTICPAMSLPTTSTDRDDATVIGVPGPSLQCDSIPSAEDLRSQMTLSQLLQSKKKYSPNHPQAHTRDSAEAESINTKSWPLTTSAVVSKNTRRNSVVWEFIKKCAVERSVAICNLCQMRLKNGKDTGHLGTTCLRRHMNNSHTSRWRKTLRRSSSSSVSTPTVCPAMSLPTTSTDRDDATVMDEIVNSSSLSSSSPDSTWVPDQTEESSEEQGEEEAQQTRGTTSSMTNRSTSQSKASHVRAAPVQRTVVSKHTRRNSAVCWEFFKKCAADPTVAICNLCQMRLKRGIDTGHLGTMCLRQHMTSCHISRWRKTLRKSSSSSSVSTPTKKYSPNHPQAQRLNASLAKLLALQLLPFQLVDSAPFHEFAECAVPQWQVPKRHYFSSKAIPARGIQYNVIESLGKAVSSKVHVTLDTWSSKHGQGRYISFTAHWVTLIAARRDPRRGSVLELIHPPHLQKAVCIRSGQVQRWLTQHQLELGMIICDNGSNLLSALCKGKLTHVPCLAHVLNLVVQRFLTKYPGLPELLIQARKVCSHFRRSFPASVRLAEIQREFHLPTNRLICDMPTRWNSTLAMLQHLHKQQRDASTVLSPFEEATRMVSRDSACISDTIPLVFLLEHTLRGIIDVALEAEQREEEEAFPSSQGPSLSADSIPRDHYWLATLLDPRYKGKVAELILPAQREHRMTKLEDALKRNLCNTFPGTVRLPSADTRASEAAGDQRNSGEGQGRLTDAFLNFFSPRRPGTSNVGTHCQRLHHMVQDYLGARADLDTFPADDPLAYWVLRLDHWPELSQYAMQLLGCPSSSVLSERMFSAAGGFVTDKRVRLSTDSVDRLTFIKMNQGCPLLHSQNLQH
uniref:BED-type domain-containing protein n=1 Tax=Leptobrachium leishanense TaxID=445787 RepID=A0A8C5MMB6_9ANUR